MHSKIHSTKIKGSLNAWLYSTVFLSKVSMMAVLFLFASFVIQPFHQAMAMEPGMEADVKVAQQSVSADPIFNTDTPNEADDKQEVVEKVIDEDNTVGSIELPPNETELVTSATENDTDADAAVVVDTNSVQPPTQEPVSTPTSTSTIGTNATTSTPVSTSTVLQVPENDNQIDNEAASGGSGGSNTANTVNDSTDDPADQANDGSGTDIENQNASNQDVITDDEPTEEENSDSTVKTIGDDLIESGVSDIVNEMVTLTRQLVTEENYYQFSRQSCAPIGDGTFHCTIGGERSTDLDSIVYAQQVEGGDMEIFMRTSRNGVEQVTDNTFEDTAPDYDAETQTLVWQRLIDGRYQVISYDLATKKETQLTFSRTNSMDPKVSAQGIVWQAWDGSDWEIVFFDGSFADVITDNNVQDVTPVIEDGYILWSILGGDEQEARVYAINSGETLTIRGHEGGAIANPRFVLVYDTKFDNGDVITKGFDPITGLSAPIAARPAEAPIEIPETDPVGEIRALIQNKSTQEEQEVITDTVSDGNALGVNASTTSANNLNLASSSVASLDGNEATQVSAMQPPTDFELTEYDLVITPTATSTSLEDIAKDLPPTTQKAASSTQQ